MTRHFSPSTCEATAIPAMLIDAARCWRDARDSGQLAQPSLSRALAEHDCTLLAPVLDSLCLFYEAALGRPMAVGSTLALTADERLLLDLLDGSHGQCLGGPKHAATALDCALCSTRVMLALTLGQPVTHTLQ